MGRRAALGKQGIHIIKEAADHLRSASAVTGVGVDAVYGPYLEATVEIVRPPRAKRPSRSERRERQVREQAAIAERRNRLRTQIEAASVRPAPGSSDLLARPLRASTSYGYTENGKLGDVVTHDLCALAPIHLYVAANEEGWTWTTKKTIRR